MSFKKSIPALAIINMARKNSQFNTKTSKINRKWTRYLKLNKLFDEYMVYLSNYDAVGAEPNTYKELSNLCYNLDRHTFYMENPDRWDCDVEYIRVNWKDVFRKFAWDSIKWYDLKNIFLYAINKGYIKKSS